MANERLTDEQERLLVRAIRDRAGLSPDERDEALGVALRELQILRAKFELCDELRIEYREKLRALQRPVRAVYPDDSIKGGEG